MLDPVPGPKPVCLPLSSTASAILSPPTFSSLQLSVSVAFDYHSAFYAINMPENCPFGVASARHRPLSSQWRPTPVMSVCVQLFMAW